MAITVTAIYIPIAVCFRAFTSDPRLISLLVSIDRWRRSLYVVYLFEPSRSSLPCLAVFVALENFLAILAYWTAMYIPPNLIEPLIIRRPASVLTYPVAIWNDRSKLPVGYAAIAGMICVSPASWLQTSKKLNLLLGCPHHHCWHVPSLVGRMDCQKDTSWRRGYRIRNGLCRDGSRLSAMSAAGKETHRQMTISIVMPSYNCT